MKSDKHSSWLRESSLTRFSQLIVFCYSLIRTGRLRDALAKALVVAKNQGLQGLARRFLHHLDSRVGSYQKWIDRYDVLSEPKLNDMQLRIAAFHETPLISVVMPTYNPNVGWLIEAIDSVRGQLYENWELCIADDASTDSRVRETLSRYAKIDSRIKVAFRPKNGHISATSNSALALAKGKWIALLDHDDLLPRHALFWVAYYANLQPDTQMMYSDEDKIDEAGRRFEPYFKCDWNHSLFYSQNMFSHLGVYRASLVSDVGGFRLGLEGSQDYDLALRCIERVKPDQIRHIPQVLYHWRVHAQSTAGSMDAKPYAVIAGERALNEHFQRVGVHATATHVGQGYRIDYDLAGRKIFVSIVVNAAMMTVEELEKYIQIISSSIAGLDFEFFVYGGEALDNRINVASRNDAIARSSGEFICMLDGGILPDTSNWLQRLVSLASQSNIGAVAPKITNLEDIVVHAGFILGSNGSVTSAHYGLGVKDFGYFGRAALTQDYSAVSTCCVVVKRSVLLERLIIDNRSLIPSLDSDVDFCLRLMELGYRNVWEPFVVMKSPNNQFAAFYDDSRNADTPLKSQMNADFAYSRNLTLGASSFSLAFPPR